MSTENLSACSISLRAARTLRPGVAGWVLGRFERVCDLTTDEGGVAALVWGGVGNGPLNVVLNREPGIRWQSGARFIVSGAAQAPSTRRDALCFSLDLSAAKRWEARPDWEMLGAQRRRIAANARWVEALLIEETARRSNGGLQSESLPDSAVAGSLTAVERGGQVVAAAYRDRNRTALAAAIARLCGLGPGLTPAGDDWLAGWLLACHLAPDPTDLEALSGLVMDGSTGRTTTLSRAFLASAAAGEADAAWHALLDALASESTYQQVSEATQVVLAHGVTSGLAMLMGFVAGADPRRQQQPRQSPCEMTLQSNQAE